MFLRLLGAVGLLFISVSAGAAEPSPVVATSTATAEYSRGNDDREEGQFETARLKVQLDVRHREDGSKTAIVTFRPKMVTAHAPSMQVAQDFTIHQDATLFTEPGKEAVRQSSVTKPVPLRFVDPRVTRGVARDRRTAIKDAELEAKLYLVSMEKDGTYHGTVNISRGRQEMHYIKWVLEIKDGKVVKQYVRMKEGRLQKPDFLRLVASDDILEGEQASIEKPETPHPNKDVVSAARRAAYEKMLAELKQKEAERKAELARLAEEKRVRDLNALVPAPELRRHSSALTSTLRRRTPGFSVQEAATHY